MTIIKYIIQYPYNILFYMIAVLTCCLEVMGLYSVLGLDVTILIAVIISITKAIYLLNKDWKVYVVLGFSMFFSIQKPMLVLINKSDNTAIEDQIKSDISSLNDRLVLIKSQYESSKKVYDKATKDGAWGILRDYDKSDRLNKIMSEIDILESRVASRRSDLTNLKVSNENWYKSFLRLIVILVAEFLLFVSAGRFSKLSPSNKKYLNKRLPRYNRKLTKH